MTEKMKPKILCVDDEAVVREALKRLLMDVFQVFLADSAKEARTILASESDVAIVLTDHGMPSENGLDFLKFVREQYPQTARALLTGRVDIQSMESAVNSGLIQKFILKPWENAYLHLQMLEALQTHQSLKENAALEKLSVTDQVTQLHNHRYFQDRLRVEVERAIRHAHPVSMMMIDIDNFKTFNDQFGHPTGDTVLRLCAARLTAQIREIDTVARYGGEEFAIILPDTTFDQAMLVAERVRKAFESEAFSDVQGRRTFVTISLGVATVPQHATTVVELIKLADDALYRAKRQGRNQSVGASS